MPPRYCCEEMAEAVQKGIVQDTGVGLWVSAQPEYLFEDDYNTAPTKKIKFCPYCGKNIEGGQDAP